MNCSTPDFPVLHYLPEFAQTHIHWVSDAIQPSHPLSTPSPPALNLFQHQDLFQWMGSSHQVAKFIGVSASASVLPMNIQSWFPSGLTGLIFLLSKRFSRVFSRTKVRKHQFFSSISLEYMLRGRKVGPYFRCLFNFLNFSKTGYTNSISTGSVQEFWFSHIFTNTW